MCKAQTVSGSYERPFRTIRRGRQALGALLLTAAAAVPATGQEAGPARGEVEGLPVDRWLAAHPGVVEDPAATSGVPLPGTSALAELAGHPLFLPDRDLVMGGVRWHLLRRDGAAAFELDGVLPDGGSGRGGLAHAYVRAREDRTVRVAWTRPSCGRAALWLNGQRVAGGPTADAGTVPVRLARGWNTLLIAFTAEGCPGSFGARLLPASGPGETGALRPEEEATTGVDRLRVQASRPPGVHRTWPSPWVTLTRPAPWGPLAWRAGEDELRGPVRLEATAWGRARGDTLLPRARTEEASDEEEDADVREEADEEEEEADEEEAEPEAAAEDSLRVDTVGVVDRAPEGGPGGPPGAGLGLEPPDPLRQRLDPIPDPPPPAPRGARVDLEVGGEDRALTLTGLEPARPRAYPISALTFERLREGALDADGVRVRLRWGDVDRRLEGSLPADALLRQLHGPIALEGWRRVVDGEPADGPADPAEVRAGERLAGSWRVPAALAGFTLVLDPGEAPGRYSAGERDLSAADPPRLCAPCRAGQSLDLEVEATGEWSGPPVARIAEPGYPAATDAGRGPEAEAWLRALGGGGGNREYRELAEAHAPAGEGG